MFVIHNYTRHKPHSQPSPTGEGVESKASRLYGTGKGGVKNGKDNYKYYQPTNQSI
jgi:hypothetical protein